MSRLTRFVDWLEPRALGRTLTDYLVKKVVPEHRHSFWYYFGGLTLFFLTLQIVTGILLAVRYKPSADPARDPRTNREYCLARASDSLVIVTVTDSTLFNFSAGDVVSFPYHGAPDSGLPEELRGKAKIVGLVRKDSIFILPFTLGIATAPPVDSLSKPTSSIVERVDAPEGLAKRLTILRDSTSGIPVQPSVAFMSIREIDEDVPMGKIIRAVHAHSANLFLACLVLHMFSAFLMRGYRAPRELMWVSGVLLLLIALGFGFTGYLLPWNRLSYFATRVGVGYPENFIPGIGRFIADMFRGGSEVDGETLTRMFALHTAVLPLSVLGLAGLHMALLQVTSVSTPVQVKYGGGWRVALGAFAIAAIGIITARVSTGSFDPASPLLVFGAAIVPPFLAYMLALAVAPPGEREIRFYWSFAGRDYVAWATAFGMVIAMAAVMPLSIGGDSGMPIDIRQPLETPIDIHPEWYFMSAFAALRLFPGLAVLTGAGIGVALWIAVPFLDRASQRGAPRTIFTWLGIVVVAVLIGLTWYGYRAVDEELKEAGKTVTRSK
jgi:quinol-cytochrome oxidoreductase complex cytochrome b subunit